MKNRVYHNTMTGTKMHKVGFSGNWINRRNSYITDNPLIEFIEYIETYKKTKHRLEKEIQKEVEALGGRYVINHGKKTEWFEFDGDFSLDMLNCCKRRKIIIGE